MKTLFVDQNDCISCGLCSSISPDIFEQQENGKARVKKSYKQTGNNKHAKNAIDSCPVGAIKEK